MTSLDLPTLPSTSISVLVPSEFSHAFLSNLFFQLLSIRHIFIEKVLSRSFEKVKKIVVEKMSAWQSFGDDMWRKLIHILNPSDICMLASTCSELHIVMQRCVPHCSVVQNLPFGIYSVREQLKTVLSGIGAHAGNQCIIYKRKGYLIEYPVGRPINEFSKFAHPLSSRHNFVLYTALSALGYAKQE